MDFFAADWMSEMEWDDDASSQEWQINSIDAPLDNYRNVNPFSPSSYVTYTTSSTESAPNPKASEADNFKPKQQFKNSYNIDICIYGQKRSTDEAYSFPSASIISFGKLSAADTGFNLCGTIKTEADLTSLGEMCFPSQISPISIQKLYAAQEYSEPVKGRTTRSSLEAQYHVLEERKRREKLSELFISLSAMIPGLKKLHKASILGGTIDYLKELEERLRTLEQEQKKRKLEKSVVSVSTKRSRLLSSYDASFPSDENLDSSLDQPLPEIEVRICGGKVLVGVYCSKRSGIIREILCEIEKLDLCIINSSVIPFGDAKLHMTIIGEMNGQFCMRRGDLAENIRQAILKLM